MANNNNPWIALAATAELPIVREPIDLAAQGIAEVHEIALPYKPLSDREVVYWAKKLEGAGAILLRSGYITDPLLQLLPDLKIIAVHGAGIDPVDLDACTKNGVVVTNTPGANADAVTEITLGLMLSLARRIPAAAQKVKQDLAWDDARYTGTELKEKTLGLLGLGQIGCRVATIAKAFGMNILAYDPALSGEEIQNKGAKSVSLKELAMSSDFLSLHAPAIESTKHIVNKELINYMKPSAFIINCARGSLIDEIELAKALSENQIAGAALDVLEGEPPDPNSPIFIAPNVILTPHMAGSTSECLHTIAEIAAHDIVRVLNGGQPDNPMNKPI